MLLHRHAADREAHRKGRKHLLDRIRRLERENASLRADLARERAWQHYYRALLQEHGRALQPLREAGASMSAAARAAEGGGVGPHHEVSSNGNGHATG